LILNDWAATLLFILGFALMMVIQSLHFEERKLNREEVSDYAV